MTITDADREADATQADIDAAAIYWLGQKDRETFPEDLVYFKANWRSLLGLKHCVLAFAAHRIAAEQAGAPRWQPIETAPRDGSFVDLWMAPLDESGTKLTPCRVPNCYWVEDYDCWYAASYRGEPIRVWHRVTHWQPLPEPPALDPEEICK